MLNIIKKIRTVRRTYFVCFKLVKDIITWKTTGGSEKQVRERTHEIRPF